MYISFLSPSRAASNSNLLDWSANDTKTCTNIICFNDGLTHNLFQFYIPTFLQLAHELGTRFQGPEKWWRVGGESKV